MHALCATLIQSTISLLFQLWIAICLKHWIPNFLSFKTICGSLKNLMGGSPYFELKSALLYCHALCTALLQSVISPSFQLRIVICLKSWIFDFLRLKNVCGLPQKSHKRESLFWVEVSVTVLPCYLHSLASISYNSLVSTPNYDPFEALDSWLPKIKKDRWLDPRNSEEVILILS